MCSFARAERVPAVPGHARGMTVAVGGGLEPDVAVRAGRALCPQVIAIIVQTIKRMVLRLDDI